MQNREIISSLAISRLQKKHFIILDVLPFFGTLVGVYWFILHAPTRLDVFLFLIFLHLSGIGVELGYHRLFSHLSFKASPFVQALFLILGATSGQGPAIAWVSNHRHHHKFSDEKEDTHSPIKKGFWHAHLFWKWSYPFANPNYYCPKLAKDPYLRKIDSRYYTWVLLFLFLPALLSGLISHSLVGAVSGFFGAGVIRMWCNQQITWCVNSVLHLFGSRRYETQDHSRNLTLLAPFMLGITLHNNHHQDQHSANNAHSKFEIDPGFWILRGLQQLGLIWDLKTK